MCHLSEGGLCGCELWGPLLNPCTVTRVQAGSVSQCPNPTAFLQRERFPPSPPPRG